MNYKAIYDDLILNALTRPGQLTGFTELHHIIPRSHGGSDENDNLVELTLKEHCLAHKLLNKIYPDCAKMQTAYNFMCTKGSRYYVQVRTKIIQKQIGKVVGISTRNRISYLARKRAPYIAQVNPKTHDVIAIFNSAKDAADHIDCHNDSITNCCIKNKSKLKYTIYGFIWSYASEYTEY